MPINIKRTTTNKGRYYEWRAEDGKFWSVTTIVNGGLPKPVLVNWAKKYVSTYAVDNYKRLGALLEPDDAGFVDKEGAIAWLKDSPYRDRDRKGALGTLVHDAAEAYILGKPFPEWGPDMAPRMEQFMRFLDRHAPDYMEGMVEAPVYNRAERYAGTLDGICTIGGLPCADCQGKGLTGQDGRPGIVLPAEECRTCRGTGKSAKGRRVLIDYKTGKGVYPEVALQLAAYRHAEFIGAPDGSEIPMPEVDACVVLHIPDEGEYQLIEVQADEEVFQAFKYVREVFRFMEETSKRVILGRFPSTLESMPSPGAETQADRELAEQLGIATVAQGQTDLPERY